MLRTPRRSRNLSLFQQKPLLEALAFLGCSAFLSCILPSGMVRGGRPRALSGIPQTPRRVCLAAAACRTQLGNKKQASCSSLARPRGVAVVCLPRICLWFPRKESRVGPARISCFPDPNSTPSAQARCRGTSGGAPNSWEPPCSHILFQLCWDATCFMGRAELLRSCTCSSCA